MVRLKNRYLLVNILYPTAGSVTSISQNVPDLVAFNQPTTDSLTSSILQKAIRNEVAYLFGDFGSGAIADSLQIKYLSAATSTFIIRVSRAHYRLVWAALSFMNAVPVKGGEPCVFRVVKVSGTIRKTEEEAIRRSRVMILRARRELEESSETLLDRIIGRADKHDVSERNISMSERSDIDIDEADSNDDDDDDEDIDG